MLVVKGTKSVQRYGRLRYVMYSSMVECRCFTGMYRIMIECRCFTGMYRIMVECRCLLVCTES